MAITATRKIISAPLTSIKNRGIVALARDKTGIYMGEFPSGQRGQTVNLLSLTSVVRIHLPPPTERAHHLVCPLCWWGKVLENNDGKNAGRQTHFVKQYAFFKAQRKALSGGARIHQNNDGKNAGRQTHFVKRYAFFKAQRFALSRGFRIHREHIARCAPFVGGGRCLSTTTGRTPVGKPISLNGMRSSKLNALR